MSEKHHITINKTATYYTLGNIKTAKTIWFVLHGYGMLAEFFIKKFEPIVDDNNCIIAPEGLSKFYTKGFYGRVGAGWMTKEDREVEITDYINYLNQLYREMINGRKDLKINVVGFSQGGATASRWIANNQTSIHNFILWSSIFPEDMNFKSFGKDFSTYIIYGNQDEFAKPEHFTQQKKLLKDSNIDVKIIEFDGTHDIPENILLEQRDLNPW